MPHQLSTSPTFLPVSVAELTGLKQENMANPPDDKGGARGGSPKQSPRRKTLGGSNAPPIPKGTAAPPILGGGFPQNKYPSGPKLVPKLGKARLTFQASRTASGTAMPKLRITPFTWSTSSAPHVVGVPESSSWAPSVRMSTGGTGKPTRTIRGDADTKKSRHQPSAHRRPSSNRHAPCSRARR